MGIFSPSEDFLPQADVAQLVERSIRNRQVSGSTPLVGSIPGSRIRKRLLSLKEYPDTQGLLKKFFLDSSKGKLVAS